MSTVISRKSTKAKPAAKTAPKSAKAAPKASKAAAKPSRKKSDVVAVTPPETPAPVTAVGAAPSVPGTQPEPSVIDAMSPIVAGRELRKKELFDLVSTRSGMKKKDVKPVVEAMLAVMGEALSEHREMHLMPLGKIKIQRAKELKGGRALILKLRQNTAVEAPSDD